MFIRKYYPMQEALLGGDAGGGGAADDTGTLDAGGAGPEAGAVGDGGGSEGTIDFPEGLSDDIKNDPSLKVFVGEDNKINYANMMKSYVHAQKQMGKDKAIIPDQNASEEVWNEFFNKVGRPDLENYELNMGEVENEADKEFMNQFKEQAYNAGLLPKQAQNILNWYEGQAKALQEQQQQQAEAQWNESLEGLKKEWGEGFEKQQNLARQAYEHFVDEGLRQAVEAEGLDNSVTLLKVFNKIGQALMTEDNFTQESKGSFGMTPDEAQAKINSYMSDPMGPYLNGDHVDHKRVVAEVAKLSEILYR